MVAGFTIDATTNLPTNTAVASALRDAVCAQVEYWSEQGEEADVIGQTGTVSVGGATYRAARKIAPRAKRHLSKVGLLSRQVSTTPGGAISSEFFDE